jgi:hypothetical protein
VASDRSDEERIARELAEELERLRVEDVVVQTLVTASSIGYRCLGLTPETREARDLAQVRLAIDTMQALIPVLEAVVPAELVRDLQTSVANLQLIYAKAVTEGPEQPAAEREAGGEPPEPTAAADAGEEPTAAADPGEEATAES